MSIIRRHLIRGLMLKYLGDPTAVKKQRPVNLNLFTIKFPIPAIASILHRISGIILFLLIPLLLWMLQASLASEKQFLELKNSLDSFGFKFILWVFLAALFYHLFAGIRHLLMDTGVGESLQAARFSAWCVMVLTVMVVILTGIWLW